MDSDEANTKRWEKIARISIILTIIVAILTILGSLSGVLGGAIAIVSGVVHGDPSSSPTVRVASTPLPTATPTPLHTATLTPSSGGGPHAETTGGEAHTWTSYISAGGTEGPTVAAYQTIQVACKVTGFKVADGNTWWYRIASSPWNNTFYVSADAFYNNGAKSGSLSGTPWVDPNVPNC